MEYYACNVRTASTDDFDLWVQFLESIHKVFVLSLSQLTLLLRPRTRVQHVSTDQKELGLGLQVVNHLNGLPAQSNLLIPLWILLFHKELFNEAELRVGGVDESEGTLPDPLLRIVLKVLNIHLEARWEGYGLLAVIQTQDGEIGTGGLGSEEIRF